MSILSRIIIWKDASSAPCVLRQHKPEEWQPMGGETEVWLPSVQSPVFAFMTKWNEMGKRTTWWERSKGQKWQRHLVAEELTRVKAGSSRWKCIRQIFVVGLVRPTQNLNIDITERITVSKLWFYVVYGWKLFTGISHHLQAISLYHQDMLWHIFGYFTADSLLQIQLPKRKTICPARL